MDLAHIHLLLNHFPTIGNLIGGGLFALALIMKSDELKRVSLAVILGMALISIPTYMSGNGAQEALKGVPGISKSLIETHEGVALEGLALMEITGIFAWLGLWQFRRLSRIPNWNLGVIMVLVFLTFGFMARAANIGGEIRHAEIRVGPAETVTAEGALARNVGMFITENHYMWPTCETLHFIGLTLLMGVVLLVDLRVLGIVKGVSYASLHRLLPWAAFGFGINVVTGILFFVGIPGQYTQNHVYYWKLGLVMLAGLNAMYFTFLDEPWKLGPSDDAPLTAKIAALSAMALWIGVMFCGSMLPFLGNSF